MTRIATEARPAVALALRCTAGTVCILGDDRVSSGPPVLLSIGTPAPGNFSLTPDGSHVVYSNNYNNTGVEPGVYSVPVVGGPVITLSPPEVNQIYLVSHDSAGVFVLGDPYAP